MESESMIFHLKYSKVKCQCKVFYILLHCLDIGISDVHYVLLRTLRGKNKLYITTMSES